MREGFLGDGPTNFDPKLNWYGLYKEKYGYKLKEVEITIYGKYPCDGCMNSPTKKVETNIDSVSMFLIGSKFKMNPDSLIKSLASKKEFSIPGERQEIWESENSHALQLYTTGTVNDVGYCPELEDFELRLSKINRGFKPEPHQNILVDFEFRGECNTTKLIWCGDLNGDGLQDLIFSSASTQNFQYNLFLGDRSEKNKFVKFATSYP